MSLKNKKPKVHGLHKFILVLAVLTAYSVFAMYKYGIQDGLAVTWLTWAFFVFATPIADAGFLMAFPIRIITGFKMLYTQIGVWIVAGVLTVIFLSTDSSIFNKTPVLDLYHRIITNPWPLWSILVISLIGTFVSIKFDDEVYDVATSKNKKKALHHSKTTFYARVGVIAVAFILYFAILQTTETHIDLL